MLFPEMFFASEAARPFRWGETDCVSTVDRWCAAHAGRGFVATSGLAWASEIEAERILRVWALPVRMARAMRAAGFARTDAPQVGDAAVVQLGPELVAAVKGVGQWLFRREQGVSGAAPALRVVGAWRVA